MALMTGMIMQVGQQVVWTYRPQHKRSRPILVDAEVIQYGQRRTRIRITTARNGVVFRWVDPKNVRPKLADEPSHLYPVEG